MFTAANFPASPLTSPAGDFTPSDLRTLRSQIKKYYRRHLVLEPDYYAALASLPGFDGIRGWEGLYEQSDWSTAQAKVIGIALSKTAIIVANNVPDSMNPAVLLEIIQLPNLGISCGHYRWFVNNERAWYESYGNIFGAAVAFSDAGILLMQP